MKILFVCLGNICRSPAAEGVMNKLIEREGLKNQISCDSAGTTGYHEGERADLRMREAASKRGFDLIGHARQFDASTDFTEFDYIITMDESNFREIVRLDHGNKYHGKIAKMTKFSKKFTANDIPDPYYGGADGFNHVLDLLEDACNGLLTHVRENLIEK
jgi:protein-tyrosine phosphatase